MQRNREVIVIGGGLTGLTCAWQLKKNGHDVEILERDNRIGGLMQTVEADGFIMEQGPSTGTVKYPEVAELFDDLRGHCEMEEAAEASKCRLIWKGSRFHALPAGPLSALTTPLFTMSDKLRILFEPFRKRGSNPNETVGELAERRLGKSFVDYAVDPFLSGVYAGDPYRLPTRLALPKLYQLEQRYGSFIRGSLALARKPKTARERRATKAVFSVKGGFGQLIEALGTCIGTERITLGCHNIRVEPMAGRWKVCWGTNEIIANHVVTTCPAYALPSLLSFLPDKQLKTLSNLYYAPVVEIAVGLRDTGGVQWNAFGGLIPSLEHKDLLGILMPSACFTGRAPQGGSLFACFLGGVRHPEIIQKTDEELTEIANKALHDMLKFPKGKQADLIRIFRHPHAIPQYMENTDDRLTAIDTVQAQYPTLHIAGNIKDGIGMGDRIKQAVDVANAICQK